MSSDQLKLFRFNIYNYIVNLADVYFNSSSSWILKILFLASPTRYSFVYAGWTQRWGREEEGEEEGGGYSLLQHKFLFRFNDFMIIDLLGDSFWNWLNQMAMASFKKQLQVHRSGFLKR